MAEVRQVSNVPEVIGRRVVERKLSKQQETVTPKTPTLTFEGFTRWLCRTKQKVYYNSLWPTTWGQLVIGWIVFFMILIIDHPKLNYVSHLLFQFGRRLHLDEGMSYIPRVFLVSLASSVVYFIVVTRTRQYLLRILLSYKGWLYQPPRSQSKVVLIWGLLVRIVSGREPRMYSYQPSLPRMKVPSLKTTKQKILESLKPILDNEEYKKLEEEAKHFFEDEAPKLQWLLWLKSWWAPHYMTDWWERYVYLMSRAPIAVNSNYAALDAQYFHPTKVQCARAAGVTSQILFFKSLIDSEKMKPLVARNTIPFCMWQYERLFSSVRVPGVEVDEIVHHSASKHIAVLACGHFYKLYVSDSNGKRLNVLDLQTQYERILEDAQLQTVENEAQLHVASLTANERTKWSHERKNYFSEGVNKESIKVIEESIMLLVLDDFESDDPCARSHYYLGGNGSSIWFDKSLSVIVLKDGQMGMNIEHAPCDGPVPGSLMEYIVTNEYNFKIYDDVGNCKPYFSPHQHHKKFKFERSKCLIPPSRLKWDITPDLEQCITEARTFAIQLVSDVDVCVKAHTPFSKGFIKKTKNSPDTFIQIALQMAYHKDSQGCFALTYESSMTRLFRHGRTETVRPLTLELQEFIRAMGDPEVNVQERVRLMQVAVDKHTSNYRDCMAGKGADRHLFALYVACKWTGSDNPFCKKVLAMPWTLSTTQLPMWQSDTRFDFNLPEVAVLNSFGGGFGPACDDGYGVSYTIPNDNLLYFYVSAKNNCDKTSAQRFMNNIFWAMTELKDMYEQSWRPGTDSKSNGHLHNGNAAM